MARPRRVLSHLAPDGAPRMVDVGEKPVTHRVAVAEAWVDVGPRVAKLLASHGGVAKGDALTTARLAGIQAAKRTAELIPLCHPLPLSVVDVSAEVVGRRVRLRARVECHARTGVEMEALTAVSVAALTVVDMVKSAGKGVVIGPVGLVEKQGGKSGSWKREDHLGPR
ncbi:MAG: cyclic pyranopterin monophosphate synthase MoaC [Myxococcales bacterium]|nr:cyclic pyranopterin monophosphate synthase MoaC [Myxococcales bacterium]